MKRHGEEKQLDLNASLEAKAKQAWEDMPPEVANALRKQLFTMSPFDAIKVVGGFFKEGRWSIRPYPGVSGFGELGLIGATFIHKKLCESDG